MILFAWGYVPFLFAKSMSLARRIQTVGRFLKVDWNVLHGHRPCEIASVGRALAERPARDAEAMVEAGCWRGGSSAKFSILCRAMGLRLHIYDSFLGVHTMSVEEREGGTDFSGAYAATEAVVRETLKLYGEPDVCDLHKGWFWDTVGTTPVDFPVRAVYIDCDTVRGTREVLNGVMPNLVFDGVVFSQDAHIESVIELLSDPDTWLRFGKGAPSVERLCGNLASFRFAPSD